MTAEPYYPYRPGYVRGSDTSADAADSLDDSVLGTLRRQVFVHVRSSHTGATCDEVERDLELRHQTASARLRELVLTGWLCLSGEKRRTRSGRMANVYRPAPSNEETEHG